MTLLDDIKKHYEDENYPPDGPDLDYDFVDGNWQKRTDGVETELVSEKVIDDSLRWGDLVQWVYKRSDDLVAVEDVRPATEMQDWGDYGEPSIYPVRAVEVTVTKYEKVEL